MGESPTLPCNSGGVDSACIMHFPHGIGEFMLLQGIYPMVANLTMSQLRGSVGIHAAPCFPKSNFDGVNLGQDQFG